MAFNRLISVLIGKAGGSGLKFSNLRMSFDITKTNKSAPNQGVITLYNMSEDSISKAVKIGNQIIVEAGYVDEGSSNLFFGVIKKASKRVNGVDREIEITAYDGIKNYQNANISLSYSQGTTADGILADLVDAFGYPLAAPISGVSKKYEQGYSFNGKVRDALTEVTNYVEKIWYIQNEQIVIISKDESINKTGLVLSRNTGLIDVPELLNDQDEEQNDENPIPKRYRIKSLLFPQLYPGSEIKIESKDVNGFFRIETAQFIGDNLGSQFNTILEVTAV